MRTRPSTSNRFVSCWSGASRPTIGLSRPTDSSPRRRVGLAPVAVDRLYDEILALRDQGVGILLVEQYPARALAVADEVVALERGSLSWSGIPAELGGAEQIMKDYLGARR